MRFINFMILTLLVSSTVGADTDLLTAYRRVLSSDANFLAARASAEADREELPKALAGFLPSVSFSGMRSKMSPTTLLGMFLAERVLRHPSILVKTTHLVCASRSIVNRLLLNTGRLKRLHSGQIFQSSGSVNRLQCEYPKLTSMHCWPMIKLIWRDRRKRPISACFHRLSVLSRRELEP